ncbi:hypothetical protein LTR70_000628 [Exophiala xenobiotica]|uniref:GPI anchored protein n=1 Tax=Lithohypha guttulata TaxID=1690604 RepID=A0ABR0KIL3_9EURO|nr:hypothetical protein LTR24_002125 [Lithohypha guttulata]KAK5329479.1 hypothetical protein LTR70_000628 [Exophiala xenobiotica]
MASRAQFALLATFSTLAILTSAQTAPSTAQIFFPYPEGVQPYDASVIAQDATATTLAVVCASPTPTDCNFPSPITLTVGPSTFHHSPSGIWNILGEIDCTLTSGGKDGGECAFTLPVYNEDDLNSATTRSDDGWLDISTPAPSSETSSVAFSTETEMGYITVTVAAAEASLSQAGSSAANTGGTSSSASSTNSLASGSSSAMTSARSTVSSSGAVEVGKPSLTGISVGLAVLLAMMSQS